MTPPRAVGIPTFVPDWPASIRRQEDLAPGRYHVFIDESEFAKQGLVTLGALLVREEAMAALEKDVTTLRMFFARQMRKRKYTVYAGSDELLKEQKCRTEAARIRAGGLPEIHAKEIWQSAGVYHCERSDHLPFRRNEWVSRVVQIIEKHKPLFVLRNFQGGKRVFQPVDVIDFLKEKKLLTPDLSTKKISELQNDVHFAITFELFMYIDSLRDVGIEVISVTCDAGKRTELFGKFDGFDRGRTYGFWSNFPNPVFLDSHASAGVQLSDFITYFFAKVFYYGPEQRDTPEWKVRVRLDPFFRRYQTSSGEGAEDQATAPPAPYGALMAAMQLEAALLHCGGQSKTQAKREEAAMLLTHYLLYPHCKHNFHFYVDELAEAQVASYRGPVWPKTSIIPLTMEHINHG